MRGVGWFDLSEKGPGAWGVGWLVEDVACIRGALGRPREDVADAAHVHHGAEVGAGAEDSCREVPVQTRLLLETGFSSCGCRLVGAAGRP